MSTAVAQEHPYRFEQGQVIDGRYRVLEPLGYGGFAEVYKCRDSKLDKVFAVKVMNLFSSPEDALREARTAAKFQHPNILRMVNIGEIEETGNWYLVMDYEEGSRSLEQVLDQVQENLRRLPLDEGTLHIISQVASALHYAHGMGIVHRDVKPSNIIVDAEGNAYLTDFGLALTKVQPGDSMKTWDAQSGMSGTIPYMSPEQFEERESDKPIGPSSDIYSLGVVAYEMLVGQLPYPGKAAAPIIRQIIDGVRTPPRQLNAEIEEKVQNVLLRVLDKDPEKRYQTAEEFAHELGAAAQSYITAEKMYKEARTLFDQRSWREALISFEQLEEHAPSYKETRLFLERVRKRVQLLDLHDQAWDLNERGEHEACLEKLKVLSEIDPNYVVTKLHDEALASLTEKLYLRATDLFQSGKYQACLDTFQEIRRHDPGFADRDGLAQSALKALEHDQYLDTLYRTSIEQIRQEEWAEALKTLVALQNEEKGYADVEARLTMVRHMARLSGMYQSAQELYDRDEYGLCIDQLRDLVQVDDTYKTVDIETLHRQAVVAMYQQAEQLLMDERYEQAIETVDELNKRTEHGDPDAIQERARQGIAARELHHKLTALYTRAGRQLQAQKYRECLETMREIRAQDPNYPDIRDIEQRAREQHCITLYNRAQTALNSRRYAEAWRLWEQITECDPNYGDPQDVSRRALEGMERRRWLGAVKAVQGWLRSAVVFLSDRRVWMTVLIGLALTVVIVVGWLITQSVVRNNHAQATMTALAQQSATAAVQSTLDAVNEKETREAATAESIAAAQIEAEATATAQAIATWTAEAEATQVVEAAQQATAQVATATAAYRATRDAIQWATAEAAQATASHEATKSAEETAVAVLTVTAQAMVATAKESASVLPAPVWREGSQLGYVSPGDAVTVLGRASDGYGGWLYVRTADEIEGFVAEDRFEWGGDVEALPVVTPSVNVTVPPRLSTDLVITPGTLAIEHIWPRTECVAGGWRAYFEVKIKGGNGRDYTLYWDDQKITYERKQDEPDVAIVVRDGISGLLVGTIKVQSGGETASQETSASPPKCN